jgi:hypothetical protein
VTGQRLVRVGPDEGDKGRRKEDAQLVERMDGDREWRNGRLVGDRRKEREDRTRGQKEVDRKDPAAHASKNVALPLSDEATRYRSPAATGRTIQLSAASASHGGPHSTTHPHEAVPALRSLARFQCVLSGIPLVHTLDAAARIASMAPEPDAPLLLGCHRCAQTSGIAPSCVDRLTADPPPAQGGPSARSPSSSSLSHRHGLPRRSVSPWKEGTKTCSSSVTAE